MKKILVFIAIFAIAFGAIAQEVTKGTFTDPRDGQVYPTITIEDPFMGETVWMAKNLNYKTSGSVAYDNNERFRKGLGLLYSAEVANKVCPDGWHLASLAEWKSLVNTIGNKALLSKSGWKDPSDAGNNSSGFNVLPGGEYFSTEFDGFGQICVFWTSSMNKDYFISFVFKSGTGRTGNTAENSKFYIRCVKD